jgi:hypothetical protein
VGKNNNEYKRKFIHTSRAWYAESALFHETVVDSIYIGLYSSKGDTEGEFSIEWVELTGMLCPKLIAYDDAWSVLYDFKDVLKKMADVDDCNITPDEMRLTLISCGVEDATPVKLKDS